MSSKYNTASNGDRAVTMRAIIVTTCKPELGSDARGADGESNEGGTAKTSSKLDEEMLSSSVSRFPHATQ